jgi:hypothetical protein
MPSAPSAETRAAPAPLPPVPIPVPCEAVLPIRGDPSSPPRQQFAGPREGLQAERFASVTWAVAGVLTSLLPGRAYHVPAGPFHDLLTATRAARPGSLFSLADPGGVQHALRPLAGAAALLPPRRSRGGVRLPAGRLGQEGQHVGAADEPPAAPASAFELTGLTPSENGRDVRLLPGPRRGHQAGRLPQPDPFFLRLRVHSGLAAFGQRRQGYPRRFSPATDSVH